MATEHIETNDIDNIVSSEVVSASRRTVVVDPDHELLCVYKTHAEALKKCMRMIEKIYPGEIDSMTEAIPMCNGDLDRIDWTNEAIIESLDDCCANREYLVAKVTYFDK